jgi:hypothetical protein
MNLNRYKQYVEALRGDEHSHLNDGLAKKNRISEADRGNWNDDDDSTRMYDDDELWGRPNRSSNKVSTKEDDYDEEEDDDIENDDMQHLMYLLRTMFKNSGVDHVEVEHKKMDITIYCMLNRKERLKDIIKIFEVANKLKRDILAQYDSEFDMWSNRDGSTNLVFTFLYDEGLGDDNAPF